MAYHRGATAAQGLVRVLSAALATMLRLLRALVKHVRRVPVILAREIQLAPFAQADRMLRLRVPYALAALRDTTHHQQFFALRAPWDNSRQAQEHQIVPAVLR